MGTVVNMRNPMHRRDDGHADLSTLAVLAAAAREAEELLAAHPDLEPDLEPEVIAEADRRLKRFMKLARQRAR
jgi:hypothetical protein